MPSRLSRSIIPPDSDGKPLDPKIENVARNITRTKLDERLEKYRIAVNLQEVERKNTTRVDMYFATHDGRNLPIEAKRHFHSDLWVTANGQLQDYTTSDGATGHGVLLVFWFGDDWAPTPKRPDGKAPASASELERLLLSDLQPNIAAKTDVIVLDVSRPEGGESQVEFSERMKESGTPRLRKAGKKGEKAGDKGKATKGAGRGKTSQTKKKRQAEAE